MTRLHGRGQGDRRRAFWEQFTRVEDHSGPRGRPNSRELFARGHSLGRDPFLGGGPAMADPGEHQ